jgi:hypothetical protein
MDLDSTAEQTELRPEPQVTEHQPVPNQICSKTSIFFTRCKQDPEFHRLYLNNKLYVQDATQKFTQVYKKTGKSQLP